MKIAIAQIKCLLGDVSTNISKVASLSQNMANEGCQIIVFAEMMHTGYEMSVICEKASSWDEASFQSIHKIAADHGIHLICGISEKKRNKTITELNDAMANSSEAFSYQIM